MENTTHLFLATRFNCNKCHDHPFERWTQDQYYQMAAFFAQVRLEQGPGRRRRDHRRLGRRSRAAAVRNGGRLAAGRSQARPHRSRQPPAFPFDCKHEAKDGATRREQLAAWITSPDNPYFAKSYVNRIWGYMMGRGIVEPLDDIRPATRRRIPELLDYLTSEFVKSGFNTRHVMSLICKSRTYQLSVETNKWNEDDQINFSHARARRLAGRGVVRRDLSHDRRDVGSSRRCAGSRAATLPDVGVELPDGFLGNLGRPARESACECERSSNLAARAGDGAGQRADRGRCDQRPGKRRRENGRGHRR